MAAEERYRRKQFSSCDTCRASRVRCNRSLPSANDNQDQKCSNCKRRGIPCTFNWLRGAVSRRRTRNRAASYATVEPTLPNSHSPPNLSRSFRSDSTSPATEQPDIARPGQSVCLTSPNLNPTLPLSQSLITSELKNTLWGIFSSIFEPVFAIWLSGDCCPYGNFPNVRRPIISQLVLDLDRQSCECSSDTFSTSVDQDEYHLDCPQSDETIRHALATAVHCFSARWLPLIDNSSGALTQYEDICRDLWLTARAALLGIMDRPSYQSILALYLFSMTPLPPRLDDGFANTNLGEVFVQIALGQYHVVRAKRRNRQFSGSKIMGAGLVEEISFRFTEQFVFNESLAYWAGVVIDNSTSLTLGRPSILLAGVLGFADESVSCLIQARRRIFHEKTNSWRECGFEVTNKAAMEIIQSAAAWKSYLWKAISVLREAITYGHGEDVLLRAQRAVIEGLDYFRQTYASLLLVCEKNLIFLDQEVQLSWYLVTIHYHMGILILFDVLSSAYRIDLIADLYRIHKNSVQEVLNAVSFALNTRILLFKLPSSSSMNASDGSAQRKVTLLNIDPYPHHVVVSLQLVTDTLLSYIHEGGITNDAFQELGSRILHALDELPQYSKSLQSAKTEIRRKLAQ